MGRFLHPEDLLIRAVLGKEPKVNLQHCSGKIEGVFKKALKKEPRILAFLSGYEAECSQKGEILPSYEYDVTIQYQEPLLPSIDDVVVDTRDWDATSVLTKGAPKELALITRDTKSISKKLTDIKDRLLSNYEGLHECQTSLSSVKKLSRDTVYRVSYTYILPQQRLRQLQGRSAFEAKGIWKNILGKSMVPDFVKPFLAFSYLTQECCYDQRAFDEFDGNPSSVPRDPIPHLAYGPLVENRGISSGLAWAFKVLMDEANIECLCVSGYLKEDLKNRHMWNLVKIDGQYYHLDPTWGIKNDGVCVGCFMKPDTVIKSTHLWAADKYPIARGKNLDYDVVEEFLAKNGNQFLVDGANERYFFPEKIID